ncbi:hypothetical protein P4562_17270 [Lysinibacillus xylanilyticus]|uniref:glycine-rich domain-containing protein n=1 Tax=Lysinibacillus xylanilyticus TaxID=582475 RepID=UPI002E1B1F9A|nr:hypothetical protein [Lysinibacillus xylanilyticus]
MSTQTKNYGFTKDNENDFYNVNTVNNNLDKIDTEMKRIEKEAKSFNQQVDDNTKAIAAVDTKVDNHTKENLGHIIYLGYTNAPNAWVCTSDDIIWEVSGPVRARRGSAYRVFLTNINTGNVTLTLKNKDGSKVSSAYPVLNIDGSQILPNSLNTGAMVTVAFNGSNFFLQGSGSGVNIANGSQKYDTAGTYQFTVPKGVTRIMYKIWGAGGGGGGSSARYPNVGGGGGGGGAFIAGFVNVTPGYTHTVIVGKGGVGGAPNTNVSQDLAFYGEKGGFSMFGNGHVANGGGGGSCAYDSNTYGRGGKGATTSPGLSGVTDYSGNSPKQGLPIGLNISQDGQLTAYIGGTDGSPTSSSTGGSGAGGNSDAYGGYLNTQSGSSMSQTICNFYPGEYGGPGASSGNGIGASKGGGGGGGAPSHYNSANAYGGYGGDGRVYLYW